jgi:hypothetical protein
MLRRWLRPTESLYAISGVCVLRLRINGDRQFAATYQITGRSLLFIWDEIYFSECFTASAGGGSWFPDALHGFWLPFT